MESGLRGKIVIITGASGGIGAGIARAFAAEGASLALHYRKGLAHVRTLQVEPGFAGSINVQADLTRESEVRQVFAQVVKRFGRVDTLVANAASWETQDVPFHTMSMRQWKKTMDGVLTSTFLCAREFLRHVARQKHGNMIFIASTAAIFGEAGHADYAAAKAAVAFGLTRTLKNEMAKIAPHTRSYCGGRVNCICPGWTVVPRLAAKLRNTEMLARTTATMALPQLGRPEDVGHAAAFLASDELARHVTGQIITIAGGMEGRLLWSPGQVDTSAV